jgi:hypothetical protein
MHEATRDQAMPGTTRLVPSALAGAGLFAGAIAVAAAHDGWGRRGGSRATTQAEAQTGHTATAGRAVGTVSMQMETS